MVGGGRDYSARLQSNVHLGLATPEDAEETVTVRGDYLYYHYGCDGFDDRGWGCGYRTLMTLCSWVRGQREGQQGGAPSPLPVPSNTRIQELLVEMGDKETSFIGSRQWIGSVEVSYILDSLYDVPCKILHMGQGKDIKAQLGALQEHFRVKGAPVMMGGETDVSSKGVMGVCRGASESYLLVVDPHFWGEVREVEALQGSGWVKWQPLSDFHQSTFYNMCLPQLSATRD
ncbi:ufm1-specific protease 1-like [Portunus trituberculatus]|uniref:ufm1-specific protease 1-like n=1 Tax=Portunus trituberculatus TaxID=210409 RepID=UPI001E1D212E|nr:ufm1-specific protease 1-like [Portunus trituberculatus]XP_045126817.1 ufm1-specific protease 1-like [Portunus trituberculatus]XP_045126826.1 ufm1-specific protease 1-like [Portunus trituberculatus]